MMTLLSILLDIFFRGGGEGAAARVFSPHTCNLSAPLTGSLTSMRGGGGGMYIVNYIYVLPVHSTPPYLSFIPSFFFPSRPIYVYIL
jgi:hypothetical protein